MALNFWEGEYQKRPAWEVDHPQRAFVELVNNNEIRPGRVLDIGCGTGENAIFLARNGFSVVGIDLVPLAIEQAKQKALKLGAEIDFSVGVALHLGCQVAYFSSVIDSGLFHIFDDKNRSTYVEQITRVLGKDGAYFMLCFSETEPKDWGGPRRVSKDEIEKALSPSFEVNFIRETILETNIHKEGGGRAYISSATKRF
ncbi:MAG: class I SAM-dependent methyltransferase [Nitrososphaerales archaeon]